MIVWPRLYNTILAISVQIRHDEKSETIGQNTFDASSLLVALAFSLYFLPWLHYRRRYAPSPPLEDERFQECLPLYFCEDSRRLTEKAADA